VISF